MEGQLQPGDLTAQALVALHRDLDRGDPRSVEYRRAWDAWQERIAQLAGDARERVAAYVRLTFPEPEDPTRAAGLVAGAGAAALAGADALTNSPAAAAGGARAIAPDAAAHAAAGQAASATAANPPTAVQPDAAARAAAGDADSSQWSRPRPNRRGLTAVVAVVAVTGIGAGVAIASHDSKPNATVAITPVTAAANTAAAPTGPVVHGKVLASTPIGRCVQRFRVEYRITGNAKPYVGKTAVVAAKGSREGTVSIPVKADGSFIAVFTETLAPAGAGKCNGAVTYSVESIGGVRPSAQS